jgi:3-oxoacyl-[acyl-carrier-protein] synthase II
MRSAYIIGTGIISPQLTWEANELTEMTSFQGTRLTCLEPDYSKWLDIKQLRRMSRVMKMGAAAAKLALQRAGINVPDAIITGTGLGCQDDTGIFLKKMIEFKEEALNPTPFIQSTHNTIGSHIAFLLQCLSYNQTYSHGAFSFESAVLDGLLHLTENNHQKILVGTTDEITNHSHAIIERFGILKRNSHNSLEIFKSQTSGTLHGEGSAWFVLSGQPDTFKIKVEAVETFFNPEKIDFDILKFTDRCGLTTNDIDLVLSGKSGDFKLDNDMDSDISKILPSTVVGVFKHLCGEYFTATSFALWLAYSILKSGKIPSAIVEQQVTQCPKKILIYNRYLESHHTLMLVTRE